jgi:histidinol dehydrogenase
LFVTTDAAIAGAVNTAVESQLKTLSRADIAASALENSRTIIVEDVAQAIEVSNQYAPEHLILQIENPRDALPSIRNAGSVFVGQWTPESVGDYCSGTNHVLPTYGNARTYSGLGVEHFMRQMTIQELSREGLQGIGDAVISLASLEGLDAHAAAVIRRLGEIA